MKRHTDEEVDTSWSPKELQKMAETGDLHISPFREDEALGGQLKTGN